jgi:hypothetical protein
MLGFFNRAIADWNAWESDLKQVLVEAKAEGWSVQDRSTFFGVRLVLTRGVATATYNGPMSGAAESVKAIVQFCKAE